jgi:threonine/homoserine/homoserine lactone efflux protein
MAHDLEGWRPTPELVHWSVFLTATLILLWIPGPSVLFVVARGMDQGFRAALLSSMGRALGDLFQVLCAALGRSALLASSVVLFGVLKYAGAAYLIFLGLRQIREKDPPELPAPALDRPDQRKSRPRCLLVQAFSVNALNPKTALFCLALLPQFVSPSRGPAGLQILVLGAVFVALGFMTNTVYGGMAGMLGSFARGSLRFQKAARDAGGGPDRVGDCRYGYYRTPQTPACHAMSARGNEIAPCQAIPSAICSRQTL